MAAVLGVSAHYHDAAAALVVDGVVIAAIQEERLSGLKNDASVPWRAIRACLEMGKLAAGDLDQVVYYESPYAKLERVLVSLVRTFPFGARQFVRGIGGQVGSKLWVLDELAGELGIARKRVTFRAHHESHAASAFFASPFERAAVLTVDGVGETDCTCIHRGDGDRIELVERIEFPHSLGLFYAAMTAYLGFAVNEGELSVMGLSAHGTPSLTEEVQKLVRIERDGSYELDLSYFGSFSDAELAFGPKLETLLGPRRPYGKPWDLESAEDRRYADIAASAQCATEDAMVALAKRARSKVDADALCLAGGVALNALANARIAREAGFARVFVQPAAGDAGGALGAAILGAIDRGDRRPAPMTSAALGLAVDTERAVAIARELGLSVARHDDIAAHVAEAITREDVVAFVSGRFEWGPRALGQRSILASPVREATRERVNRLVKRREPFRPFAPAILTDDAARTFEDAPSDMTRFMTTVCRPRERSQLEAVTHVDGTARVQTVDAESALGRVLAHVPGHVVLNTSLNGPGEPICATAEQVVSFFLRHPVDALYVEDVCITKAKA